MNELKRKIKLLFLWKTSPPINQNCEDSSRIISNCILTFAAHNKTRFLFENLKCFSSIFHIFYWRLLGCSTGVCSTIQIEQKLFDDLKSWDVRLRLCLTENWQLSNIKLIELNQKNDYVRLILISTLKMDNCRTLN